MKILIAYASYNSTTETCAKLLAEKLPDADIVDLTKGIPVLSDYDTIVIGSCIRFNIIHNAVKNFIGNNLDTLMNMNTAIYLCCGFPEKANQYLLHNFPKKLLNKSVSIQCFGGKLYVKPYRLHDKLIMNIVRKNFKTDKRKPTYIDNENILKMVDDIKNII
ncbi:MAG: flavodoxin domain-containing protein [Sedimentibacter sp.]|uniref:flavodoxin domain-containing protein n=1 Tax=Sedimentibacter sp. TaxID=1960295 RepID=UPI002982B139|nr:flavodoxin domain-containing protein [Sedimentibacter sp.]MDW5300151.1 flavodoxin domain-containing protein [Sedimentibacter sp.]